MGAGTYLVLNFGNANFHICEHVVSLLHGADATLDDEQVGRLAALL